MASLMMAGLVMTLAATGSAGEPLKAATTRPKIELAPTVKIVGFHRPAGQTGAYTGGALQLAVDVENTGNADVSGIVVTAVSGGKTFQGSLSIGPKQTRAAILTDADGLSSSCEATTYQLSLSGPGTGAATREGRIMPSCKFTSTLEETWNQMRPDTVEANKAGNAYLTSPSIVTQAMCGKASPTIKVKVINKSSKSTPSLIVQAKEWSAAAPVKAQTAAAFPLATGEMKDLVLTPVANGGSEPPAKMKLAIHDWTKSLGGNTSDGGIFVNTTRSCSLDFDLE